MQHPDVAIKAQKEIENVVGSDRLPTFADRPALPYIDAVMSEVLRWGTPVPLGLAHPATPLYSLTRPWAPSILLAVSQGFHTVLWMTTSTTACTSREALSSSETSGNSRPSPAMIVQMEHRAGCHRYSLTSPLSTQEHDSQPGALSRPGRVPSRALHADGGPGDRVQARPPQRGLWVW